MSTIQKKVKLRIKKKFLYRIYSDIIIGICIILLAILIPILLSTTFTPGLISEEGKYVTWACWFLGILIIGGAIACIFGGINGWISSRWRESENKVMEELVINENARRQQRN